jgi:hypothetical protein
MAKVVQAMFETGHQGAGIRFPEVAGGQADAGAWSAFERDAHRGLAQGLADFGGQREASQLAGA